MKVRVEFDFNEEEISALKLEAIKRGFLREEPRNRWTHKEEKEAIRFAIQRIVSEKCYER